ncbi:MAG TPA: signal peptidase II [Fodinibius sp.]|nr:signal peptidase II [Fodinibius sp.]
MISRKKVTALTAPIIVVVILDQLSKHWIRLSPQWQNVDIIPGWLAFHYTLNPGMAMGMRWMSTQMISVVAIIATLGILAYVLYNIKKVNAGYLFCMGLILGGATGNVIDRLIMANIGNYGGILEGHVIDFIHFDLEIAGYPVFPYIFNVADIAISVAIIVMLLFHNRIMPATESHLAQSPSASDTEPSSEMSKSPKV